MRRPALVLTGMLLLGGPARADSARVEVPISQAVLPNNHIHYAIPLRIGGTTVQAMLDTGSTGLRVLPDTLAAADYEASDRGSRYSYSSGALLEGVVAHATIALGSAMSPAPIPFEAIRTIGCMAALPDCPASRIAPADFGIGGEGFAKQGYRAILGTGFRTADVDNPLMAMGVRRWIVELPRPGESNPGRLILNPTDDETKGYVMFALVQGGNAVPGCLVAGGDGNARICGRVMFDTGSPVIFVESRGAVGGLPWKDGTPAMLVVQNSSGQQLGTRFVIGAGTPYAVQANPRAELPFTRISGSAPYFAFSVLYDADAGAVGLKAR